MADDEELYHPPSDFLCAVIAEEIGFGPDRYGRANLAQLIALTSDADDANRDWATFLLAQSDADDAAVRAALRARLDDPVAVIRDGALVGVAKREPAVALPIVHERLRPRWIGGQVIEAAAFVADASLLPALHRVRARNDVFDAGLALTMDEVIEACTTGVQPYWRDETVPGTATRE